MLEKNVQQNKNVYKYKKHLITLAKLACLLQNSLYHYFDLAQVQNIFKSFYYVAIVLQFACVIFSPCTDHSDFI